MSKECTCHHHACDCREEHFKKIEEERNTFEKECNLLKDERNSLLADVEWLKNRIRIIEKFWTKHKEKVEN
jgi:hypothetical protein